MFKKVKTIHFIGIGGTGMCGLAEIIHNMGYTVTGSDLRVSEATERLESLGIKVFYGHSPSNLRDPDLVVVSSAVKGDNPELVFAAAKGIPIIPRAQMLAELMRLKEGIAVAGTHGKSTTTSLIGEVLTEAGLDPTIIVGGRVVNLSANAKLGTGKYLVAEADEYDRSFLRLAPTIAVVTAIEPEHLECYSDDFELLKRAFLEFMNKVPFYGAVFACADENVVRELIPEVDRRIFTYGIATSADIRAIRISFSENRSHFTVVHNDEELGDIDVKLLGLHNVRNCLAAVSVGLELGIPFNVIQKALEKFKGVYRRFQIKSTVGGIMVVDDYAHHYTEIRATLQGAKLGYKGRRIIAVFQPHLYSRTRAFYRELGKSLLESDILFVTDVYPAREEPIEGITGELVANAAKEYGHKEVYYSKDLALLPSLIYEVLKPSDIVITLGAGDIWKVGEELIKMLEERYGKVSGQSLS